jgi:hypothetical protein
MHNAPSVSYPVGRCAFQRWLYVGFTGATCAVWLAWFTVQAFNFWMLLALLCIVLGGCVGWRDLHARHASLSWDGQAWCLQGDGVDESLGDVHVAWDVQKALLLRWQPASTKITAGPTWLWLGQEQSPTHWHGLRCAVYQPAQAT